MKRFLLISMISVFFIGTSYSQNAVITNTGSLAKWKVNALNLGLGANYDMYPSMSLDHILMFAKDRTQLERDLSGMEEEVSTFAGGAALYSSIALTPFNYLMNKYRNNQELQIGFALHTPKEAMVYYKNQDLDTSIVYCNVHGEVSLEAAYVHKGTFGKRWHWYAGGGMNMGLTFANEMILVSGKYFDEGEHPTMQESLETNRVAYKAKPVYYSRLYVPAGIHYRISKKVKLGIDYRTGIGVQLIKSERANFIRKTGAFILSSKISLGS